MKKHKKTLFVLILLYTALFFLTNISFAAPEKILRFEQGDILEEIRAKIEHNEYSFTVDHNWVFDMSAEEKKKFLSRHAPLVPKAAGVSEDIGPLTRHLGKELPSSFDWRAYNGHSYIGPIRDQGICGSCYAFSACASAEGTYNWANDKYDDNCADFSEAFVAFCLSDYYSGFDGCYGASYDYEELDALVDYGVCNESVYPYTDEEQECQSSSWDASRTVFRSWHRVTCSDIDAIKTAIMTYGVVDAAVYVGDAFMAYSEGIYEDSNTSCYEDPCYYTPTNHAIALVGWNDNGGDGYWILRNSWGTSWGESGYMRIKYTSALVACEVCYLVTASASVKLTASDGAARNYFGHSVSISGDYAIIGAEGDDDSGIYSGSAYVLERTGSSWIQVAKLTASDGAARNYFGHSVSISGDYAIVGAWGDDDNGIYSGSAYIFERTGSSWTQVAKLTASDGAARDYFGRSVSISGDYAIVGAGGDDDNGSVSGSAYIFERTGGSWTQVAKIMASDGAARDYFGRSVSISGNYAIVGANYDDDNGSESGSAYIFERTGSSWTQVDKITASDGATGDYFGISVSISGDYTIVGAGGDDDNGSWSGSAYIFERTGGSWTQIDKITASDGAASNYFGFSVSISGDYAIVGAEGDGDNGSWSGSAYIFEQTGGSWTQVDKLTASDGESNDRFGCSVSISGDYAIVGVDGDDDNGSDSGSAYCENIGATL